MNECKRSCCWTPFTCGRQRNCACHQESVRDAERTHRAEIVDILRGTTLARVKAS